MMTATPTDRAILESARDEYFGGSWRKMAGAMRKQKKEKWYHLKLIAKIDADLEEIKKIQKK